MLHALDLETVDRLAWPLALLERVDLVEDQQLRHLAGADLVQHALDFGDLLRVVRRDRVFVLEPFARRTDRRCSRGMSALMTSLTNRFSSASRNLAMRSSSRRILLANWAVSRSPTSSARASSRE